MKTARLKFWIPCPDDEADWDLLEWNGAIGGSAIETKVKNGRVLVSIRHAGGPPRRFEADLPTSGFVPDPAGHRAIPCEAVLKGTEVLWLRVARRQAAPL